MPTESDRLRQALVDIAAAGGWQGRFAQEALDADPLPDDDDEYDALWGDEDDEGEEDDSELSPGARAWHDRWAPLIARGPLVPAERRLYFHAPVFEHPVGDGITDDTVAVRHAMETV